VTRSSPSSSPDALRSDGTDLSLRPVISSTRLPSPLTSKDRTSSASSSGRSG
jgi:hypothetical protein